MANEAVVRCPVCGADLPVVRPESGPAACPSCGHEPGPAAGRSPAVRAFRATAVRYWEWRRLIYNVALAFPAGLGYMASAGLSAGVGDVRRLDGPEVAVLFAVAAVGANVCYSFAYAVELLLGSDDPRGWWPRYGRGLTFAAGLCLGGLLALAGGADIARQEYPGGPPAAGPAAASRPAR